MDKQNKKEEIIAEYLKGETTYRQLSAKYGYSFQTIHSWVQETEWKGKVEIVIAKAILPDLSIDQGTVPTEMNQLEDELHKSRLENKLLNAMIDIAEEQLGIDIRKKSGAKRS